MLLVHRPDAEDLVLYRVAELRTGSDPLARPVLVRTRERVHIVVKRGDGSIEDPSAMQLAGASALEE